MWIPRFSVNEHGDIKYISGIQNSEEGFEIPEIFAYRQTSETSPNFLLTGAWVAINADANITSTIAEMNSENGKYGFIKNTIATQMTSSDITAMEKYINNANVSNENNNVGETIGRPQINDISNPNRTILKIINQDNQEPIKARGNYNKETGLIEIQITYSQYGIEKVLYEDSKELKLTKNNNKATATSEGLNIKYGTALITVIDKRGNTKELEIEITSKVYVTLYTDGTLGFCSNNSKIPGKTVEESYGDISTKTFDKPTQVLWYGQRGDITTVEFVNEIAPISTANWFWGIQNLTTLNNIENLNTVNVTNMLSMFNSCTKLTSLDVSNFDTSNVINMGSMFTSCISLTSLDVSNFDTSNVTNMASMFERCTNLTQIDLSNFNTSNVVNMTTMFSECSKLTSLDLSNFDINNVTNMGAMFLECTNLTQLDLSNFDTRNVTNINNIFRDCTNLSQITFGEKWNKEITLPNLSKPCVGWYSDAEFTKKVAEAGANYTPTGPITIYANVPPDIFVTLYTDGTLAFTATDRLLTGKTLSKDYGQINGQEFTTATQPWRNEWERITSVDIVDEIMPISTAHWFESCTNLTTINNIVNLNTNRVTNMSEMFCGCISLIQLDLRSFNTENVTDMSAMFATCTGLQSINLSSFNTSNVTNMRSMFYRCESLTQLNLNTFDTSNVTNITDIFYDCTNLSQITFGEKWNKEITLPNLSKPCVGWYSDAEFTEKIAEVGANYTPAGPITIYADVPSDIYVTLYTDGTLGFCSNNSKIEGKEVSQEYGNIALRTFDEATQVSWYRQTGNITTVEFVNEIMPISTAYWFMNCTNLTIINNIANLNTSRVTNMSEMFCGCISLIQLDLSNFNTENVTDMSAMFASCTGLQSINLSSFNTSNVTNMRSMFYRCESLTQLNLNTFDTSNVTNITDIFYDCTNLSQITFGEKWNKEITLPTSKKTSSGWYSDRMFINKVAETGANYIPVGPITIYADVPSDIYVTLYTDGTLGFCSNTSKIEGKEVSKDYGDISGDIYDNRTQIPWYEKRDEITAVEFVNKIEPVSTMGWFWEFSNLTTVNNIINLDTSNVTNMNQMFYGCSGLTSLDLRTFDTSKVTDMSNMFNYCINLIELNIRSFNTSNVTNMNLMFCDCDSLTKLDLSSFDTTKVTDMYNIFNYCTSLSQITFGDKWNKEVTLPTPVKENYTCTGWYSDSTYTTKVADCGANYTPPANAVTTIYVGMVQDIYAKLYTDGTLALTASNRTLEGKTVYNDFGNIVGITTSINGFLKNNSTYTSKVTNVDIADKISPISTRGWFSACTNLTIINNMQNLDTSKVTDMRNMFNSCSGLTSLDLSNFDTSNVTNMGGMFIGCSGLTSLDLSPLDTSKVTDMNSMFWGCSGLTSLDLTPLDTSNVTDMCAMFGRCSGLTSLDLTPLDTSNVTNMFEMFQRCSGLTSLDLSPLDTSNVTDMHGMFQECSGLTSLDLSPLDTSKVTDMKYMFFHSSSLTSLDLSNFNTSDVTNMACMFQGCSGLTSLDLTSFNTSDVTNMACMFQGCSGLTSLDLTSFNTSKVTNMSYMFRFCEELTNISVTSANWIQASGCVKSDMFEGCGTSRVTYM